MTTSKTAVFRSHGQPQELVRVAIPTLQAGEMLVRNEMTTLCRSDLTTYCGKRIELTPTILGHEIVGRVAAFGPDCECLDLRGTEIRAGDRVTWAIFASDPASDMAQRGMPQKSPGRFKYGHEQVTATSVLHGGLSEYTILRRYTPVIKVSESVPLQVAAIINCAVATIAGALRVAGSVCGRRVLISGAGMLGVLACGMAKTLGARHVIAMDIDAQRLQIAKKFGADVTSLVPAEGGAEQEKSEIGVGTVDVVIEVSGVPSAMENTLAMLDIGGVAVWIGATYPARSVSVNGEHVLRNLLTIRGLHNYNCEDFRSAVEFIERHHQEFPIRELIHDQFTLDEVEKAFEYGMSVNPFRVGVHL